MIMRAKRRNAERKEKFKKRRMLRKLMWAKRAWKLSERKEYLESQRDAVMEKLNA